MNTFMTGTTEPFYFEPAGSCVPHVMVGFDPTIIAFTFRADGRLLNNSTLDAHVHKSCCLDSFPMEFVSQIPFIDFSFCRFYLVFVARLPKPFYLPGFFTIVSDPFSRLFEAFKFVVKVVRALFFDKAFPILNIVPGFIFKQAGPVASSVLSIPGSLFFKIHNNDYTT